MIDKAFASLDTHQSRLAPGPIAARIGEEVRSWREEAGLSEAAIALTLHSSVDLVRSAETGAVCFTAEEIVKLCSAYAVSPSRFLGNLV